MALMQGRRPDPPPLETNDVLTVAVGTAAWLLGLLVLAVLDATDATRVETWWLVMCAWGALLGAVGVWYCRKRHLAIERSARSQGTAAGIPRRD